MNDLKAQYQARYDGALKRIAAALEDHLREILDGQPHIDRVAARAKSIDRFLAKAAKLEKGLPKYSEPLHQIQDQIGARIITFYLSDVERIAAIVKNYLKPIEEKNMVPESEWEFGDFGHHFILFLPGDVIDQSLDRALIPTFFELQIKTLYQHAWSEADHDLGYKPGDDPLTPDQKRRLAFTAAQSWGADRIFQELYQERNSTNGPTN